MKDWLIFKDFNLIKLIFIGFIFYGIFEWVEEIGAIGAAITVVVIILIVFYFFRLNEKDKEREKKEGKRRGHDSGTNWF